MTTGFGIIGCGMIAKFHARAIAEIRGAKLVACYNRTLDKASAFASEFGCTAYDDLEAMLARDDIHVVTICTPSGAHLEPGVLAAKAGKHILVEKPLEVTLKRCDALLNACAKAGVRVGTIFPSRFHESSRLLKQAVDQGRFGRITLGDAYVKWFRTQQYYDSGAWRGTWKLDGGGALMNQAIHSVDLLLWLMGELPTQTVLDGLKTKLLSRLIATRSMRRMIARRMRGRPLKMPTKRQSIHPLRRIWLRRVMLTTMRCSLRPMLIGARSIVRTPLVTQRFKAHRAPPSPATNQPGIRTIAQRLRPGTR
jgi:hypothetical protein